jgi:hypothetical protein
MQARDIKITLQEGKVQSKFVKKGFLMFCRLSTGKAEWNSKAVPSSSNPIWEESHYISFLSLKKFKIQLFQASNPVSETLGSLEIHTSEILLNKRSWWPILQNNIPIATIFIDLAGIVSGKSSPFKPNPDELSFRMITEPEKQSNSIKIYENKLVIQETQVNKYLKQINIEYIKLYEEKSILKQFKQNIKTKEAILLEERKIIEKQRIEIEEEKKLIDSLRTKLSKQYADLKHEKFRHRTHKILLSTMQHKILGQSAQLLRQQRLISRPVAEISKRFTQPHSSIGLSECVSPIIPFSDSPVNESPVNTQESM